MIRFIMRILGFWMAAVAFIALVLDGARSVIDGRLVITVLGESWASIDVGSLNLSQAVIQRYVHPLVWDPFIQWLLLTPTWLIFGLLALLFFALGRRRRTIIEA